VTHNLLGQAYFATGQTDETDRQFKMVVDLQNGGGRSAAPQRKEK
jgi:hypothetical protein